MRIGLFRPATELDLQPSNPGRLGDHGPIADRGKSGQGRSQTLLVLGQLLRPTRRSRCAPLDRSRLGPLATSRVLLGTKVLLAPFAHE